MRTVLLVAASTLCLAFAAHSAPLSHHSASRHSDTLAPAAGLSQSLSAMPDAGTNCMPTSASLTHVVFTPNLMPGGSTTDDDADASSNPYCSQFLSTQMLVQAPMQGHT